MNLLQVSNGKAAILDPAIDWRRVAELMLQSRALDTFEETVLAPRGEITYQFSAGGHELAQILLALALDHPHDAATVYYRSRPFMLGLGLSLTDALRSVMARGQGISDGRDVGVVFNRPSSGGATVLPMSGNVGTQYTPAAGWAQSVGYYRDHLQDAAWDGAIAVALGGDGSVATNGFWSALTMATTLQLPMLFFIEDNGYAISVDGDLQTPGGNIADNLRSFANLTILDCDGTNPSEVADNITRAVSQLRHDDGPVLLRVDVPRLPGHSLADKQAYKSAEQLTTEQARDPLVRLKDYLVPAQISAEQWQALTEQAEQAVQSAYTAAKNTLPPNPNTITHHLFDTRTITGNRQPHGQAETRINLIDAVRETISAEMRDNDHILVFGEDVGFKGGVHGATRGMQSEFGDERVFDTSLSEEGIMGRAAGMALAGLRPVPEIQFRKYLEPGLEQTHDIGTVRWRTNSNFTAPVVLRLPSGFTRRVGDPWHSVSDESVLAHKPGWKIAFPSNAQDAAGLMRTALRGNDPVLFFEQRSLLDDPRARRPYPGDEFVVPFGKATTLTQGGDLTVVTWGAMVYRCLEAVEAFGKQVEVIDLRTLVPWDVETVLRSVEKTARCLIVHEDNRRVGFGAEISAELAQHAFPFLDAPITRLASEDVPIPFNFDLMNAVVPSVESIRAAMDELLGY